MTSVDFDGIGLLEVEFKSENPRYSLLDQKSHGNASVVGDYQAHDMTVL